MEKFCKCGVKNSLNPEETICINGEPMLSYSERAEIINICADIESNHAMIQIHMEESFDLLIEAPRLRSLIQIENDTNEFSSRFKKHVNRYAKLIAPSKFCLNHYPDRSELKVLEKEAEYLWTEAFNLNAEVFVAVKRIPRTREGL